LIPSKSSSPRRVVADATRTSSPSPCCWSWVGPSTSGERDARFRLSGKHCSAHHRARKPPATESVLLSLAIALTPRRAELCVSRNSRRRTDCCNEKRQRQPKCEIGRQAAEPNDKFLNAQGFREARPSTRLTGRLAIGMPFERIRQPVAGSVLSQGRRPRRRDLTKKDARLGKPLVIASPPTRAGRRPAYLHCRIDATVELVQPPRTSA